MPFLSRSLPKPERGQAGEIAEAAALGIRQQLERILEKTRASRDLERTAVIRRPPDDDDRRAAFLPAGMNPHLGKIVLKKLAHAFEPVGEDARAFFQPVVNTVDDGAVRPRARRRERK